MSDTFLLGGDLPVHRLGYGTMRLTGEGAWGEPPLGRPAAHAVLRKCLDLGINFIDTADAYGPHIAEDLIAEALHPYPADLVIATKGGLTRQGPAKSKPCGRPDYLQQQLELSLRRLKVDRIDLYQLHRIDPTVPLADTLGALRDARDQGKIRHIGLSEVTSDQIAEAQAIVPIVSAQNRYNLVERKSEAALAYCQKSGLAFIPWYPINAGKLTRSSGDSPSTNHPLEEIAKDHDATIGQLSLAWLLHRSPNMIPIPGTSSIEHLEENFEACRLDISDDDWDEIDLILDTQAA